MLWTMSTLGYYDQFLKCDYLKKDNEKCIKT
jgi:hypothetical protein